jgi:hypothetical protein
MPTIKYKVFCPFCKTTHKGEIDMKYRKDNLFNVRKNNKKIHSCENKNCGKNFLVEIDSYGSVVAMPTPEAEKEGIFSWEKLVEGKIIEIDK